MRQVVDACTPIVEATPKDWPQRCDAPESYIAHVIGVLKHKTTMRTFEAITAQRRALATGQVTGPIATTRIK